MSIDKKDRIFGCFVSGPALYHDAGAGAEATAEAKGELFRSYIWGEYGIRDRIRVLHHQDYGNDLELILFEFYLNPLLEELVHLKDIGRYRRREKSIGAPIIIHDANFFNKTDLERREFLKNTILEKIDFVEKVVKRLKLDTNIDRLRSDLRTILFP